MKLPALAWLSPLPPVRSGVSEYSSDVLPALAERTELRLFAEAPASGRIAGIEIESPAAFDAAIDARTHATVARGEAAAPPLLPVYHMGNNIHHKFVAERAKRTPGMLVLHDLVLHHYWVEETLAQGRRKAYIDLMSDVYGERGRAIGRARADGVASQTEYFEFPLFEALAAGSLGVVVHNRRAAERVAQSVDGVPVAVVPMGIPTIASDPLPERAEARRELGIGADDFLVGTFGFLTPIKRPEVCLRAFAEVARRHPGARFIALGEASLAVDLGREAARLGIGDRVVAPGYLPYAEAKRWIAAVDVFLNLRYPTAGESSASLLRLLGWGKPVVVSDFAQFREIPEAVALRVSLGASEEPELAAVLGALATNPAMGASIGRAAARHVAAEHSIERAADGYLEFARAIADRLLQGEVGHGRIRPAPVGRSSRTPRRPGVLIEAVGPDSPVLAGTRLDIIARLTNTGDTTFDRWWTLDGGHAALAGRLYDSAGVALCEVGPIAFPRDIKPGESVELHCRFRVPESPGRLVLLLDLVIHRWGWLRHHGGEALLIPIDVRAAV